VRAARQSPQNRRVIDPATWNEPLRRAAAEALAKKREKQRIKQLRLWLELEEEERQTDSHLRDLARLQNRLEGDARLASLLAARRAGRSPAEALAEVEGHPYGKKTIGQER
jgi:hypothetical protein